jgi:hypothetical protein
MTNRRDKRKLAKQLIEPRVFSSRSTRHGQLYEPVAKEKYRQVMGTPVDECGLFICMDYPYLASSPDGIIDDEICLEVKCPFVSKDKTITLATIPYISETGLSRTHNYYYQVQGQLLCSNRQTCHFVVYTLKDMKIFIIERDQTFINNMIEKLKDFYEIFQTELINHYVHPHFS